jgi:mRNA interferase MazF
MQSLIQRGDVWWADLNPTKGREQHGVRPVLVLSCNALNKNSGTVICIPLTSSEPKAGFPLTLEITSTDLPKRSWAKISQVRVLSVDRLTDKIAMIELPELDKIQAGLIQLTSQ